MKYFVCTLLILFVLQTSQSQNPANCSGVNPGSSVRRVLLAGDSWAQYMWDDDAHNIIFNAYGHADKDMLSNSYGTTSNIVFGTPPASTSTYAVSGSEAREWVNTSSYPYLNNTISALQANPSIKTVVLSIGGNDVLAGRSGGGWYLGMGATAEAAFFNNLVNNVRTIVDALLAVRPDIEVLLSSYDFPNFNTTVFDCWIYACPKREDLSDTNGNGFVDGTEHLITDPEINQMMILIEDYRIALVNSYPSRVHFDNAVGLMHYYYGTNPNASQITTPTVPFPQTVYPYNEGGDPTKPSIRQNFRSFYDPIHLDVNEYRYKIKNESDNYFFNRFRKSPTTTIFSQDANDGYINSYNNAVVETGLRLGDAGNFLADDYFSILSFATSSLPDDASISGASIYITRSTASTFLGLESNPFEETDKRLRVDIKNGFFGTNIGLQGGDWNASATANDVGCAIGNADEDFFSVRVDINTAYLNNISKTGTTQFRLSMTNPDVGANYVNLFDGNGDSAFSPEDDPDQITVINGDDVNRLMMQAEAQKSNENGTLERRNVLAVDPYPHNNLTKYMGSKAPFIDIWYTTSFPLDLLSFTAEPKDKTGLLTWKVVNEKEMSQYLIERSKDGINWIAIGDVVPTNEFNEHYYTFVDENPIEGTNYYRIQMKDYLGENKLSPVRNIYFQPDTKVLKVYPNPFTNYIQIAFYNTSENTLNGTLYNDIGQVIATKDWTLSQGVQLLPMEFKNNLPSGSYLLKITGNTTNQQISLLKF